MNEPSRRQKAGRWHRSHCDVTPETSKKRGSFMRPPIHSPLSLSLISISWPTPGFSSPVMGSNYRPVTHPSTNHPSSLPPCLHYHPSPHPTGLASFPIVPTAPVLPCFSPMLSGPSRRQKKIPISHPRSGEHGRRRQLIQLMCVCVFTCVCFSLTNLRLRLTLGFGHRGWRGKGAHSLLSEIPWEKYRCRTQQTVH